MKEPTEKQIRARLKKYYLLIANMQAKCVGQILDVRTFINSQLDLVASGETSYNLLYNYMKQKYSDMFLGLKDDITKAYNEAGKVEVSFANTVAGAKIIDDLLPVRVLPNSKAFKITNKILSEKAISIRSDRMAKRVTSLIGDSFENDLSIKDIQRKLDVEFGYRLPDGKLTEKAKSLIVQGKFTHRNGSIYETYRIARTETMRMASIRSREVFYAAPMKNKRLKLKAVLDDRTRPQSRDMNGQISNKQGKFKYPDGKYYFLGEAPPQWSICDRETQYIVFI